MEARDVPSLRWSLTPDDEAHVKIEALFVDDLLALLRDRAEVCLTGPKGHQLVLRPGGRGKAAWAPEGQVLELAYGKTLTKALAATLQPWCEVYTWDELPGLRIEVVESKVTDADGKVVKVVGWEGKPAGESKPGALLAGDDERAPAPAPRPRPRRRKLLLAALALLVLLPLGVVAAGFVHLRHVPYTIPPELQAPAPKTQLAAALGLGLRVRWIGISGYEISDGKTIILTDPTYTRPTLGEVISGPLQVDPEASKEIAVADYILINHAHYDHAADVPAIAKRTGAVVLGSRSAINLCRSRGVPPSQLMEVTNGQELKLGTFTVLVRQGVHTAIMGIEDPMSGTIPEDAGPLWFFQYTNDGTYTYRLQANGTSLWFHPTSTLLQDSQELWPPAKNLILGVTGEPFTEAKLKTMLDTCRPRWVIPTHYDNFFHPTSKGLALMPEAELGKVAAMIKAYDPKIRFSVLDFDQTIHLPPD